MAFLGQYELIGKVAQTRGSTVWKARDPLLDRIVALKELAAGLDESVLAEEARILAGLDHPNIVRVFDLVSADGRVYLVEDWIEGASLAAVRDHTGRLTPAQALGVIRGALLGLSYAHDRQVVHGDVAPGNILIDVAGESKLIDFGAATAASARPGTAASPEAPEISGPPPTSRGTSGYRSPELASGRSATKQSDVYSAAAVLTDLLRKGPIADSATGSVRDLNGIGSAIADVLTVALSEDPGLRQVDAAELLRDLENAAERTLGPGWLPLAGMSGLVSATLGGTGVVLIGAGGTTVAAVAAKPVADAAAVGARAAAAPLVGGTGRSAKKWWFAGAGAAATAAIVLAAFLLTNKTSTQPTSAAALATSQTSIASPVVVDTGPTPSPEPSGTITSSPTQTPSSAQAPAVPTAPLVARTSARPTTARPTTAIPPRKSGFDGTYQVTTVITKSIDYPDPVGMKKVVTWKVKSTCSPASCSVKVTSSSGNKFVFKQVGRSFVFKLDSSSRCVVIGTQREYGPPVKNRYLIQFTATSSGSAITSLRGTYRYNQLEPCHIGTFGSDTIDHVSPLSVGYSSYTITRIGD